MKTIARHFLVLSFILTLAQTASADSTLEFLFKADKTPEGKTQPVLIKDGKILIRGAGGDAQLDLLYARSPAQLFIIDHRKRSIVSVDEQQINAIGKQTETVQPLLQGLGEQLAQLNPKQRAKWQQMLGDNVSLDKIAEAAKPAKIASIVKTGQGKKVAGIACEQMRVVEDKSTKAEFCLASQGGLHLTDDDYGTIQSLLAFSEKILSSTRGLAGRFGLNIPTLSLENVAGVPIEIRQLDGKQQDSFTLERTLPTVSSNEVLQPPRGYKLEPFSLLR